MTSPCYHCGDPVLTGDTYQVVIFDKPRLMCCPGCQAVATTIVDSGLSSYYQYRTENADKADLVPEELKSLTLYDNQDIQQEFVRDLVDQKRGDPVTRWRILRSLCLADRETITTDSRCDSYSSEYDHKPSPGSLG